jgi:Cu/Ag efflux pump CusA
MRNRLVILIIAAAITVYGFYAIKTTPVNAKPDLSENQVIIFTEWMGRSPQIIEDRVTYPLVIVDPVLLQYYNVPIIYSKNVH